jgi:iron complex outermembrane receptor protein
MSMTKLAVAVRFALIAGGAMAMSGMPAAYAQQQSGAAAEPTGKIEEIIVTAERRESSLQDTPIAISAMSSDLLTDRGVTDFAGVAKSSPSMAFTPYPSSNNTLILYMRGQGASDAAQITLDSAVGLYQDGFYLSRGQAVTFDLADIERVEVLRGPQGTLYGRNTTGGAVNMISKKPSGELGFKQELGFGSENRLRSLSVLDLPKLGGLSAKLSFLKREQDGYVENTGPTHDFGEEGQTAGRVALRWDNGSPLTADLFYEIGEMTGTPGYYVNDVLSGDNPNIPFVIPGYSSDGKPEDKTWRPLDLNESKADFQSMGLTLSWEISDALTLKSLTGYRDVKSIFYQDYADSFLAGFRTFDDVRFHQFSQELQALGTIFDDRLDYLIGLYYFKEGASHFENVQITDVGGVPTTFYLYKDRDVHADAESKAVFAQLTWTPAILDDRLDLTIGGRYTEDTRDASRTLANSLRNPADPNTPATQFCNFAGPAFVFPPCFTGLEPSGDPSQITSNSVESSKFNPAFTANFRWTDDVSTYLRVATGYKAGGSAESVDVGQFGNTFDPEDVTMYELGLKSYLFDRRVRLNLAVFDSEYEDMQLFFNTNPADLSVLVATNAGKATVAGAELETLWQVTDRLRLTFDYTYLDASYDEVSAPANTIFDPAVNPDSPYQVGDNIKDVFAMPYAPENSYNVGADWTFAEFDTSKLALILNYRWEDKTFLSAPAGPAIPGRDFYARDSYGLLDARVSWNIDFKNDSHGRMDVYMNNVLDDEWESHLIAFGNAIPVNGQPAGYNHNAIIWAERPIYGVNFVYEF